MTTEIADKDHDTNGNAEARALSIAKFCIVFDVGRTTVFAQIKAGALHAKKCGRRTIIPVEEGLRWLRSLPPK